MRNKVTYPTPLRPGGTIGVCAPSSGVEPGMFARLDNAIKNVRALGYDVIESPSVRKNAKCVSANAPIRASEFMSLWENPAVAAIIPPWGGEFLMDMLPCLDWERLAALPPKWLCGYSDTSTLCFALTTRLGVATLHGSNFMNLGFREIDHHGLRAFKAMSCEAFTQQSASHYGRFRDRNDLDGPVYTLDQSSEWQLLEQNPQVSLACEGGGPKGRGEFSGRILGGCLDTICKLVGTPYAPVPEFLRKYPGDNFIWAVESCEMSAADVYRTLWQMRQAGWFQRCAGVLVGRPDGYSDKQDFTLDDALRHIFECPVLTGCDIGHIPPQLQLINGARATVEYAGGRAAIHQEKT